jgi:preprotein translocase subunit SecB
VLRAGFPAVHLDPINFESLYQQQLASMQEPQVAAQA